MQIFLADLTYVQQGLQSEIMPNAIASVGAYARKIVGEHVQLRIFKRPDALIRALEAGPPDIMAFSNYAWNGRLACAFAKAFKARHPRVPVVMGGPNYPLTDAEREAFIRERPYVDFFVVKEGEVPFADLVSALESRNFDISCRYEIPSVHCRAPTGEVVLTEIAPRLKDLSDIPSPYLNGLLDEFFEDGFWPIVQTNRGCPFSCTFCVEGENYYNKVYRHGLEKTAAELEYIGRRMAPLISAGKRADMFIADSNFGMFREDIQVCCLIRDCQEKYGWPQYISVATGKNEKERVLEAARLVQGALRLSGSVQSLDENVLKNIKRKNVAVDQIMQVAMQGAEIGANTYSEIILALPGDSLAKHKDTVRQLLEAGFNKVETYTLMLLPGSELESQETRDRFGFQTRYRIIPKCFGYFEYDGETICTGEIEEVVVANDSLSFEDYLEARLLALLVVLFNNDGLFENALRFVKSLGIPVFDCIASVREIDLPEGLAGLLSEFQAESRDELWEDRNALDAFIQIPASVDRYLSGELGSNLLFKYKSRAMLAHVGELASVFAAAIIRVVELKWARLNDVQRDYITGLTGWCAARAVNIFIDYDQDVVIETAFDFAKLISSGEFLDLRVLQGKVHPVRFVHDEAQIQTIRRLVTTYGESVVGLTRALTRTNVKRLLRFQASGN
ncbi:MAG: hypothetical protein A2286_10180 [Gammaproteobacteria bacterium RIFOXYA12_FULL_61_12]|nr:MAG: hypothetical protein A2514_14880 [Gammaproteobacteria bacterium RIFOXYD12_FULL_61_37]OGT90376.1 MAG: hypothetical protein A2286_10180 [Gammaproteobacteria bacterium RIFOXYA12_FULL_61_12]